MDDYSPVPYEFPDENIMSTEKEELRNEEWTMMFDGASNALGHGIRAVLISPENQYIPVTTRLCFSCTNNVAEYEACVIGIRAAVETKVKTLKVYGDSVLVINQLNGEWVGVEP